MHDADIFQSLSPSKPRSEVAYCIHTLARRLNQTNNWSVVLKTLIIIHRAMRELDNTVWEELVNYSTKRGHLIDLSHFHDSSMPNTLDYSAWIRNYGLYLGERLQCFLIVNHDVATYTSVSLYSVHSLPFNWITVYIFNFYFCIYRNLRRNLTRRNWWSNCRPYKIFSFGYLIPRLHS